MPLPPYILRPEKPGECICTKCFLTVRADGGVSLEEAQKLHKCTPLNLRAIHNQSPMD